MSRAFLMSAGNSQHSTLLVLHVYLADGWGGGSNAEWGDAL
jgi:hypothetical protein